MKPYFKILAILLSLTVIAACSDGDSEIEDVSAEVDLETEENNIDIDQEEVEELNESEEIEEVNEDQEDTSDSSSDESIEERFSDHFRLGDTHHYFDDSAMNQRDMELTMESFRLLDEIDGVEPRNGVFLAIDIKLINNRESNPPTEHFFRGLAYNDVANSEQRYEVSSFSEDLDYEGKLPDEITGGELIEGVMLFDVSKSSYYRIYIFEEYWLLLEDEKAE